MVKREDLAAFHRERIIRAAESLFREKGMNATTVEEIARRADYSKATLYVYFRSKDEIYRNIQREAMAYMEAAMAAIAQSDKGPIDQYWAICESIAAYAQAQPFRFASMLETIPWEEEARKNSPVLEEIYQLGERSNGHIQSMIDRGVAEGVFRQEIAAQPVGMLYWGMLSGAVNLARDKRAYIQDHAGMGEGDFLRFAFETMLQALLR